MTTKILGWEKENIISNQENIFKSISKPFIISFDECAAYHLDKTSMRRMQKLYYGNELYNTNSPKKLLEFLEQCETIIKNNFEVVIFNDISELQPNDINCIFLGYNVVVFDDESMILFRLSTKWFATDIVYDTFIPKINKYCLFDNLSDANEFLLYLFEERNKRPRNFEDLDGIFEIKAMFIANKEFIPQE